ncbi:hypothetical protein GGF38_002017 [Coemansia sp. RSA 25]|nr:hypothetical protein GGF38_002017 [Coemansia sp. RSA 25]
MNLESFDAVAVATRVLYLRATTQIDELITIASSELAQRWDFLGPQASSKPLAADFFHDVDSALQWHKYNVDIGEYIRHSHFALELTEEQAEIVCAANVRFEQIGGAVHALVPFATVGETLVLVIDLLREDGEWRYMDAAACPGQASAFQSRHGKDLYSSYNEALASSISDQNNNNNNNNNTSTGDDNDDYWGQYSDDCDDDKVAEKEDTLVAAEDSATTRLMADAAKHSLLGAAAAMKALGATEAQFVALAQRAFNSTDSASFT